MHIKNFVHSKMRNELERAGTTWNKMGPATNFLSLTHTHTHTHTHTQSHTQTHAKIIGGYGVCSIIAQRNITLPDA